MGNTLNKHESKSVFLKIIRTELLNNAVDFETEYRAISSWSSLNALIILSRLNEELGVVIKSRDLVDLKTIGDLYNFCYKLD